MITIQAAMLVALGFFTAGLIGFLLAPLYGRRSARIATDKLRATMPLTSAEIAADKDRLRAKYALTIHKLEQKLEKSAYAAARQRVEINRRDAGISDLEGEVERLRATLEEHENARRVLEQTIADRMPRVELRLNEAKKLLFQRDREISSLTQSSERQKQALEEATQINAQQRDDLHRLNATLAARAARNREALADPRFDGEVALRTEIEALRTKTRDQAATIGRLQAALSKADAAAGQDQAGQDRDAKLAPLSDERELGRAGQSSLDQNGASAHSSADPVDEINRLRKSLAEAESALKSARGLAEAGHAGQAALATEIRQMRVANQDQATEIARLKASLKTYQAEDAGDRAVKESKVAMRARLSALEAEAVAQAGTIQRLRAEIAAANEKLARQAAHFMDEMRRFGAGTLPTGSRREATVRSKAPLVDRINAPRPPREFVAGGRSTANDQGKESRDGTRVGGFLRALDGAADGSAPPEAQKGAGPDPAASANTSEKPQRRPSLLERITRAEKPVA